MTVTVDEPLTGTYVSRSRGARRHSYFVLTPANHFPGRLPQDRRGGPSSRARVVA